MHCTLQDNRHRVSIFTSSLSLPTSLDRFTSMLLTQLPLMP